VIKAAALIGLFAASAATAQNADHADHVGWDMAREAKSLGFNVDAAIRACNYQIVEPTSEARAAQRTLEGKGIRFTDEAPAYISQLSGGRFGPARYHRWFDPHAEIWLVAYTSTEACRVVVLNARYAQASRPELERLITVDGFWAKDGINSTDTSTGWTAIFKPANAHQAKVEPLLKLQGPASPDADGSGLQMAAIVALTRKD
jgi:hypothetical protein